MKTVLNIGKALSDENRLRALMALREGELCACQIVELLGLAPSTTSKHMSILQRSGLVQARKEGRWMYYRLSGPKASAEVRETLIWLLGSLAKDRRVREDAGLLRKICSVEREDLCRSQRTRK